MRMNARLRDYALAELDEVLSAIPKATNILSGKDAEYETPDQWFANRAQKPQ